MTLLTGAWRDLVHAVRSLARARTYAIVCVVSLGIGMAPVIAIVCWTRIFSTPPPGVDIDGLVELVTTSQGPRSASDVWSFPDFLALRGADTGMAITGWAAGSSDVTLPASGEVRATPTLFVSTDYFRAIGVTPARGAGFRATADPDVILTHVFWQRRLNADPDILGRTLVLDGTPHVVVGVAPDRFEGHLAFREAELFVPLERHPILRADSGARFDRSRDWVHLHGRLSPGVGVTQASAAVSALTSQLATDHPATNELKAGIVERYHPLGSLEGADVPIILGVWLTMAATVLVVVCLNLSGMAQVRSAIRERDLSIRQAIGASRRRLMQHLLAEAVVLAIPGAALMSLLLFSVLPVTSWMTGEPLPARWQEALRVDVSMLAAAAGICLGASLVFGWLPAVRFSRPAIVAVLKDDAGGGTVRAGRVHRLTTALQVAIAVPLLVMSVTSLERVRATVAADLGFDAGQLYAAPLMLETADGRPETALRRLRNTLENASGVASVTIADGLPLDFRSRVTRVSLQSDADAAVPIVPVQVTRVGDRYLETMGITLRRGRGFTIDDGPGAEPVTVISTALAARLFPEADAAAALGRRLAFGEPRSDRPPPVLTVVGVIADVPTSQMSADRSQILVPLAQHPDIRRDSVRIFDDRGGVPRLMLVVRSVAGAPAAQVTAVLEHAIRDLDPGFVPSSIVTGAWLRQNSVSDFLSQSTATGIIGGVILMLAALGIYGVVGLMVATRTREIAVRVTLGASRARVVAMIVLDVLKLVAPGVAVGLLIQAAVARLDGGTALSPIEPLAYVAGAAIALAIAILASLAPARRAASVQPMVAMRST